MSSALSELNYLSALEITRKIRNEELEAEDYINSIFENIEKKEEYIHAFVTLLKDQALKKARDIDKKVKKRKKIGKLAGVAIAVKDVICTKGVATTCSSKMLQNFVPPYNATVIDKIEREDAVIVGKTNMDEFAMGTTTETSFFGATKNPWNYEKVPGGSSGGSAASLISTEATLALGSDTGGSIRCPASYCSVVGLKPTYGLVSRYGLIAYANSLEQIGPIANTVEDCAHLLSIIGGYDSRDSTSIKIPKKNYLKSLKNEVNNLKIGIPIEFLGEGVESEVKNHFWNAVYKLESLGAEYRRTSLPSVKYALATYYIIAMSEASSNLARYDGLRYGYGINEIENDWSEVSSFNRKIGFGPEVRRRIILGTYALSKGYYDQYYLKALKVRTVIREDFMRAFKEFDIIASPTMPILPFNISEKIDDPLTLYMLDILTVPANLTGSPALSVPCGFHNGLPIGLQLIGKPLDEKTLLQAAFIFEKNTDYHKKRPKV